MKKLFFLTLDEVLEFHDELLEVFKGTSGVRDLGLLESALAQPEMQLFGEYIHKDLFEMAAAYCFHLIKNHAFVDGNKRTGVWATITFLKINGYKCKIDEESLYDIAIKVATSQMSKEKIAALLREYSVKVSKKI